MESPINLTDEQNLLLKNTRICLSEKKRVCLLLLQDLMQLDLEERLRKDDVTEHINQTKIEIAFREVLNVIGEALHESSKAFISQDTGRPYDFYFWPGYITNLLGSDGPDRLTLKTSSDEDCGVGWIWDPAIDEKSRLYKDADTCIWYNRVLTFHPDNGLGDSPFVPAGMHRWTTHSEFIPELPGNIPLGVIAIGIRDSTEIDESEHLSYEHHGQLTIYLDAERWEYRGQDLARALNTHERIKNTVLWPCPSPPTKPFKSNIPLDEASQKFQNLWEQTYNIWLAMTFADHDSDKDTWLEKYAVEFTKLGLTTLPAGIYEGLGKQRTETSHPYKFWYTILLDKSVSTSKPGDLSKSGFAELGSAMILSSHHISPFYFYLVKPWIEQIYLLMRHAESETLLEQKTLQNADAKADARQQATIADYARGAAHGFKNALLLPPLVLARHRAALQIFNEFGPATVLSQEFFAELVETEHDMEVANVLMQHLQQQAQLFFWAMSPERFEDEKDDIRQRHAWPLLPFALVTAISGLLAAAIVFNTSGTSAFSEQHIKPATLEDAARLAVTTGGRLIKSVYEDLRANRINDTYIQGLFAEIVAPLQGLEFSFRLSSPPADTTGVESVSRGVLEAILVELIQNAIRNALKSDVLARPYIRITVTDNELEASVAVQNLARRKDAEKLWAYNPDISNEEHNRIRGIRGLLQVKVLEEKLQGNLPLKLCWPKPPTEDDESEYVDVFWLVKLERG